jgi:hypothetical protein
MSITDYGSPVEQSTSTSVISYWHVPSGADYDRATVQLRFFDSWDEAKVVADKNDYPPQLPCLMTLESHKGLYCRLVAEAGIKEVRRHYNEYTDAREDLEEEAMSFEEWIHAERDIGNTRLFNVAQSVLYSAYYLFYKRPTDDFLKSIGGQVVADHVSNPALPTVLWVFRDGSQIKIAQKHAELVK